MNSDDQERAAELRALQDIIELLQVLPDEPRVRAALNLLDLTEIDWRGRLNGWPGRHVLLNPERGDGPHRPLQVDNVDTVDIDWFLSPRRQ